MIRHLLKRAISTLIALFLFLTLMFFVTETMIPGDFTTQFSMSLTEAERQEIREDLGIDRPLWQRYLSWVSKLLRGNLGLSFDGRPVTAHIKALIPYTLLVFLTGTIIAFQFGQWLGKRVAWRGPGVISGTAVFSAITLYTSFPPWLAFLVTYFFARRLKLLRSPYKAGIFTEFQRGIWKDFPHTPQAVMLSMVFSFVGLWLILGIVKQARQRAHKEALPDLARLALLLPGTLGSWYALGFGPHALNIMHIAGVPILTYALLSFGETMLIMRTSMMDTLKEDYIFTAQAKGAPDHVVRDKHAARNALLPVFSRLVISLPYLLTGLVIVEDVLNWPGISGALFDALYQQDIPTVMGALLLVGVLSAITRLILDVIYVYLDPRIRYNTG
jgi:peptide/nickel transport system permease protein